MHTSCIAVSIPNSLDLIFYFCRIESMIRFVVLFLFSTICLIADFWDDLGIAVKENNLKQLETMEQKVCTWVCMPEVFKEKRDRYQMICFAHVLIPALRKQYFEAYRILLDVKSEFSERELSSDWKDLDAKIKQSLSGTEIARADNEFRYFKEHGEYPDYDQDESEEEISTTPEIPDSSSGKSSPTADKSSTSSETPDSPEQKRPHMEKLSDGEEQ